MLSRAVCSTFGSSRGLRPLLLVGCLVGCSPVTQVHRDSGLVFEPNSEGDAERDSGTAEADAGDQSVDAGDLASDAGDHSTDAGDHSTDAGHETTDAGHPEPDAGDATLDGGYSAPGLDGGILPVIPTTGLTPDFRQWLASNGYDAGTYARDDLTGGSFGGRTTPGEELAHDPVIFIHGVGDKALGSIPTQTGWTASYAYFVENGYTEAELYATTWGPANDAEAATQYHSEAYVMQLRQFLEAVLAYTGATKVDIVAHSMGVTLGRKVVLGGPANDEVAGAYDVGAPLTSRVDAFVGIAGAKLGVVACYLAAGSTPNCDAADGFFPGTESGATVSGRSAFLDDLLATQGYEGAYRYSLWSTVDEIIGYADLVYSTPTSELPGETGEVEYQSAPYDHFGLKDLTTATQLSLVRDHVIP